ncbi:MAG: LacI family transcriptional regulator [Spirochaetia bacterium]|nr:LacI family transcriptional regulator [Spirochaetia bacterium]
MKDTKISILEVARLAGVSKSTVSRVISDRGGSVSPKTLERVNRAIEQLGYRRNSIAAGLRTRKSYMVLVMIPDVANPFWSEIAKAIQDQLELAGYSVVLGSTYWSEERESRYYELARMSRFDGVILNSVTDNIERIKNLGVPAVLIGERTAAQNIDTVGTDTMQAARVGLEYLYSLGHRKIALATSEHGSERYLSLRARAHRESLHEKALPFDPELVFSVTLNEEGGRTLVHEFLTMHDWRGRADGLLCGNDILAITAINEFRKFGVIPGIDLSIVGMDDIPAASQTYPPLTTVRKPKERIGRIAAELLLRRMQGIFGAPEKHLFSAELIIRDSVRDKRKTT